MVTLIFSLLGWGVIPLGPVLDLSDFSLGILPPLFRIPAFFSG
jgi:NADH-ubiquinone oxidoreductase chain 1